MQGSARKDVVFGAARVYTFTVPGPKWKSWLRSSVLGNRRAPFYRFGDTRFVTTRMRPSISDGVIIR